MDLNEDFIRIQGIFFGLEIERSAGVLKKIKHRGGNEKVITQTTGELTKLFSLRGYMKDDAINPVFSEQFKNIVLFLILNTELTVNLNEPDNQHLMNIMPRLSTCFLANIIISLGLTKEYCEVLNIFPLCITEELIVEMVTCLQKCKPNMCVKNSHAILKTIITKISASTEKEMDNIDRLTELASILLLSLTGLQAVEVQDMKKDLVYKLMGQSLLCLLDLLLMCNEKNSLLSKLIEKLLRSCCCIMMGVTIDVFCSWAEVAHEGEVLQSLVAGKSYMFIEKYQKYTPAKELIGMIGTIAQKPRTVDDLIRIADVPTMISMINKVDFNQKQWFTALLNTQVLENEDSMQCVERWFHLCTISDVSRLLNMGVHTKSNRAKKLVIKSASSLEINELIIAITRHLYQNGVDNNFSEDVKQQAIVLFNKIKDGNVGQEFSKEIHLLVLQNPQQTLGYIFAECIKNAFYICNLRMLLQSMKQYMQVANISITVLQKEIGNNPPNDQNCNNYVELFKMLAELEIFRAENIINSLLLPLLQDLFAEKKHEMLKNSLLVLNKLQGTISLNQKPESLCILLFNIMNDYRCTFLNFVPLKRQVLQECIDVIENYCSAPNKQTAVQIIKCEEENVFISYYKKKMYEQVPDFSVLKHFLPVNFEDHAETVAHLIKILSLCVTREWLLICSNLESVYGVQKTTELLCDVIILLCELVNSQENQTEEVKCMLNGLKCCCQNLGIVIKECIKPKIQNLEEDITLTTNICRMLKYIPRNLKSEEGLSLANLLSDKSLKSLRTDKRFAFLVASINEAHICKLLAQKILQ